MWHKVTEKDLLKITAKICVHDTWGKKNEQVKQHKMQNSIASTRHLAPSFCQLDKGGNWKSKHEEKLVGQDKCSSMCEGGGRNTKPSDAK